MATPKSIDPTYAFHIPTLTNTITVYDFPTNQLTTYVTHFMRERDTSICYRNYVMQLLASLPTLDNTPPHSLCTPSYPVSVSYIQPPSGQAANQANSNSGFLVHFNQQCYNTPPSNFAQAKSGQSFYYH